MATRRLGLRGARGFLREARGIATHLALYPLGLVGAPLDTAEDTEPRAETFDLPVVLVHGYFHNRSGFFFLARALRKQGFRWVYGMNYNPLGESIPSLAARLAHHIEDVLKVSGAPRVHIVGHSLGGLIARWYVQEMDGARHVDHCVTIGTPHTGTYAAFAGLGETAREMRPGSSTIERLGRTFGCCDVTFVNLYSDLDVLVLPPSAALLPDAPNVSNHLIRDFGHTSMLISGELIGTVARHLSAADVHTPLAQVHELPVRRTGAGDPAAEDGRPG